MLSYICNQVIQLDAGPLGSKEDTIRVSTFLTGESKIFLSFSCDFLLPSLFIEFRCILPASP